jgi:SPP1 family predicted phage head-tail adaptor
MIGQMRHRVILQSQVQTQDDIGQPSTAWSNVATVWADLRHQNGLEAIKSGMDVSVVKASARIRHRAVNAGQRLVYGAAVYSIVAVLPDARRAYVDLVCESVNVDV